ncbi:MAG: hypothetical protein K6G12_06895 [Lachnospiraceae bacterium]|nr:hypothetical protein [Lachnospiraceae bacterium]
MNDYSSIIDHKHYRSKTRPHMSMLNRAAQFAPFAALTGYDEAIDDVTCNFETDNTDYDNIDDVFKYEILPALRV